MKTKFLLAAVIIFFSSVFASAALDLAFTTAIAQSPDPTTAGTSTTFTVSFRTNGGAVTNLKITGGVGGTQLFTRTYASIAADKTRTDSFNWTATAGNHTIWFVLDPDHTCGDSNYANNRIEKAITVGGPAPAGQPDLLPIVVYSPIKPKSGEQVDFSIIIYNKGNKISKLCEMQVIQNGTVIDTSPVSTVLPAGTKVGENHIHKSYKWNAVCGANIEFKLDSNNVNSESDETNNSWTGTIKCRFTISNPHDLSAPVNAPKTDPNGPDLTVKILKIYKSAYDPSGKTAVVEYEVANNGATASVPCNMTAKRGGVDEMYFEIPVLQPGQKYTSKFGEEFVCSQQTTLQIDTDNKNIESNESNNLAKKTILCLNSK